MFEAERYVNTNPNPSVFFFLQSVTFCEFPPVSRAAHAWMHAFLSMLHISAVSLTQELLLLLVSRLCKLYLSARLQLVNRLVWTRFSRCRRLQVNRHLKQEDREARLLISVMCVCVCVQGDFALG